jgi:hypothetical protein
MPRSKNTCHADIFRLENINKQNISKTRCEQRLKNKLEIKNGKPTTSINVQYALTSPDKYKYYEKQNEINKLITG